MRNGPLSSSADIAPELRLLVQLCRREPPSPESVSGKLSEVSVPTVVGAASRHGVAGVVIGRLGGLVERRTDLTDAGRRLRRRDALMLEFEREAIEALRRHGIEAVVVKGSAIARFYDRPYERGATDLDILVERGLVDAAIAGLEALGYRGPARPSVLEAYRRSHFHIPMHHPDGHVVEVHWALVRRSSPFQLDAGAVLREASPDPRDLSGPTYPVAEHLVLLVVLQNLQEGFSRLSRTVDLDRVISGASDVRWDVLHRLARDGGLRNALAVSLRLCRILFDTPIPDEFEAEIRPTWWTRWHLAMERPVQTVLGQRLDMTWATQLVFEFWLADRASLVWKRLTAEQQLDEESEALFGRGVGTRALVTRAPKLLARQLMTYATGIPRTLLGHRSQTRFWSSHASSSDFL